MINKFIFLDIIYSLLTIFKYLFRSKVTINYPYKKNKVSSRFRGEHFFDKNNKCILCKQCEKNCPANAITIKSSENKLQIYNINIGKCIFCGLCQENCPVNAINQSYNFNLATTNKENLLYTKEKLLTNGLNVIKK